MNTTTDTKAKELPSGHDLGAELWMLALTEPRDAREAWRYTGTAKLVGFARYVRRWRSLPKRAGLSNEEFDAGYSDEERSEMNALLAREEAFA